MAFGAGRIGMNVQLAEVSPEPLVRLCVQRLIAKEQDLMLGQGLMQLIDLAIAERLRQRYAFDVGADARCNWCDADAFITHGATSQYVGLYSAAYPIIVYWHNRLLFRP